MTQAFGPNTEPNYLGDLLLWCSDLSYCVEKGTLVGEAAARTYLVGECIDSSDNKLAATEAAVDRILLEEIAVGAAESVSVAYLVRGPAIIDMDQVVLDPKDSSGASIITPLTKATLQAHLEDGTSDFIPPLKIATVPSNVSTGKAG